MLDNICKLAMPMKKWKLHSMKKWLNSTFINVLDLLTLVTVSQLEGHLDNTVILNWIKDGCRNWKEYVDSKLPGID